MLTMPAVVQVSMYLGSTLFATVARRLSLRLETRDLQTFRPRSAYSPHVTCTFIILDINQCEEVTAIW